MIDLIREDDAYQRACTILDSDHFWDHCLSGELAAGLEPVLPPPQPAPAGRNWPIRILAIVIAGAAALLLGLVMARQGGEVAGSPEPPVLQAVPIQPSLAPTADDYFPLVAINQPVRIDQIANAPFAAWSRESAVHLASAVSPSGSAELYTWFESFRDPVNCFGEASWDGIRACWPSTPVGPQYSEAFDADFEYAGAHNLRADARWIRIETSSGRQILSDVLDGFAWLRWPNLEGAAVLIELFDADGGVISAEAACDGPLQRACFATSGDDLDSQLPQVPPADAPAADQYMPVIATDESLMYRDVHGVPGVVWVSSESYTSPQIPSDAVLIAQSQSPLAPKEVTHVFTWGLWFEDQGALRCVGHQNRFEDGHACREVTAEGPSVDESWWGEYEYLYLQELDRNARWIVIETLSGRRLLSDVVDGYAWFHWPRSEGPVQFIELSDAEGGFIGSVETCQRLPQTVCDEP